MGNRHAAGRRLATNNAVTTSAASVSQRRQSGKRSGSLRLAPALPEQRGKLKVMIKRDQSRSRHKSNDDQLSLSSEAPTPTSNNNDFLDKYEEKEAVSRRVISFRKNHVEKFTLTMADIRYLQRLYKEEVVNRGKQHPGDTIFQHIITRMPQTKLCYQRKQAADDKALDLVFHYVKISEIMDYVMAHLEDPPTISALLRKTGADHYYLRKFGFEADFWTTLGDAFLHCSLQWGHTRQTDKQREQWFNVFWFITEELKTGYMTALYVHRGQQQQQIAALVPVRVTTLDPDLNKTTTPVLLDE